MKMTISVGRCLKRKTMLMWVKKYIINNFATCKSLCNLQELYRKKNTQTCLLLSKKKNSNVNMGSQSSVPWDPNGWLKNDSLFMFVALIKMSCCSGLGLDMLRPDQEDHLQYWEQQRHHALVWILSWYYNSEKISWSETQRTWR